MSTSNLNALDKKVIYLDQLAISHMMKVLNPKKIAPEKGTLDELWFTLFKKLHYLCRAQLIVCPESQFHVDESHLAPFFAPLQRIYKLLSCGIRFYDYQTIKRIQVIEFAKLWISSNEDKNIALEVNHMVDGEINTWENIFSVSVKLPYDQEWINDLRRFRKRMHKGFYKVFKRWNSEKHKKFKDWFEEEVTGLGTSILQIYNLYQKRLVALSTGQETLTASDLFPPHEVTLMYAIQDVFKKAGVQNSDIWNKTEEFLTSLSLEKVPYIKIFSMLCAALANQAAFGGRKKIDKGMSNDINMISALLPYCNAVFIDRGCHSLLKENPLRDKIDYGTLVFSMINKNEFLDYLDTVEKNAPKEHFDKVDAIYGKAWRKPYTELYRKPKD